MLFVGANDFVFVLVPGVISLLMGGADDDGLIGVGSLLLNGIGDTIRISLSDDPVKEVRIGNEILKSLNLRNKGVKIISCPSCARQGFQVIDTVKILEERLSHIKTPITLSIIGCVVMDQEKQQ